MYFEVHEVIYQGLCCIWSEEGGGGGGGGERGAGLEGVEEFAIFSDDFLAPQEKLLYYPQQRWR